uniref:Uncharacterized protein n=1 Tax=Anguilla anguilla TaxID=7936 RepID=A0A0E9PKG7_ANGAN
MFMAGYVELVTINDTMNILVSRYNREQKTRHHKH